MWPAFSLNLSFSLSLSLSLSLDSHLHSLWLERTWQQGCEWTPLEPCYGRRLAGTTWTPTPLDFWSRGSPEMLPMCKEWVRIIGLRISECGLWYVSMYLFQATGIRLSIILEVFFAILMSLVIGFAYSVPLTLLLTVMFVVIIIAGFVQLRLLSIRAHKSTQASDEAGKVKSQVWFQADVLG